MEATHAEQPEALPLEEEISIVKSAFVRAWFVPALAYYYAVSNAIEDIPMVAVFTLPRISTFDHFRPTEKHGNSFVLVPSNNQNNSCLCVATFPLVFRLVA